MTDELKFLFLPGTKPDANGFLELKDKKKYEEIWQGEYINCEPKKPEYCSPKEFEEILNEWDRYPSDLVTRSFGGRCIGKSGDQKREVLRRIEAGKKIVFHDGRERRVVYK